MSLAASCPPRASLFINENAQYLAETILAQGLFYSPDNPDLLAERTQADFYRYACGEDLAWDSPQVQKINREVDEILSLDPGNPIALAVKSELDFLKTGLPSLPLSDETPITPTETPAISTPTTTIAPDDSPIRDIPSATAVEGTASPSPAASGGIDPAALLLGILLFLGGAAAGALAYRTWRLSHAAQSGTSKR